jgi:hypothetical protein
MVGNNWPYRIQITQIHTISHGWNMGSVASDNSFMEHTSFVENGEQANHSHGEYFLSPQKKYYKSFAGPTRMF